MPEYRPGVAVATAGAARVMTMGCHGLRRAVSVSHAACTDCICLICGGLPTMTRRRRGSTGRGGSSVGRAPRSQRGGRGFESPPLHSGLREQAAGIPGFPTSPTSSIPRGTSHAIPVCCDGWSSAARGPSHQTRFRTIGQGAGEPVRSHVDVSARQQAAYASRAGSAVHGAAALRGASVRRR